MYQIEKRILENVSKFSIKINWNNFLLFLGSF